MSEEQSTPGTRETDAARDHPRSLVPSPTMALEIARIDLRRGYRWVRAQDFWIAFTVIVGLFGVFFLWVTFDAARTAGTSIAAGEEAPAWITMGTSVIWLFSALLLAGGAAGTGGDLDNDGHYLTIRPAADVAGGMLFAGVCKFSVYTVAPGIAVGLGLALGTGSVLPPIGVLVAAVVAVGSAAAVGYPLGFALKGVIRRSRGLASITTILGVILGIAYIVLSVTGGLLTVIQELRPVLMAPPLSWLSDLALVTTPGADVPVTGAVGALGLAAVTVPVGVVLSVPAARYAWVADAARTSDTSAEMPTAPDHGIDSLLSVVCRAQATRGIASTIMLRAVRSPYQFVFVAPPLVGAILLGEVLWSTGTLPWFAPWFVVWYGTWIAGAVVPLNPLGNQGAALPALLTAPARGKHVVHGHVVAAALPLAPLTAGFAVGAGIVAGISTFELGALALTSVVTVVCGAILATGIGSIFPRFAAIAFDSSRRAVPPSKVSYGLFSTLLTVLVVPVATVTDDAAREITAILLSRWLPFGIDPGADAVTILSWIVLMAGLVAVPVAYRTAVHRLDIYNLS